MGKYKVGDLLVVNPDGDDNQPLGDSCGRLSIRAEWLHCSEILDALGTYWKPPASIDVATINDNELVLKCTLCISFLA